MQNDGKIKIQNEIWISDDICLHTKKTFNKWNAFFLKLFLGWRVVNIKK